MEIPSDQSIIVNYSHDGWTNIRGQITFRKKDILHKMSTCSRLIDRKVYGQKLSPKVGACDPWHSDE